MLTDFEEFAAYDCRVRPDKSDKSSAARHDRMVSLVERMLDLHKRVAAEQVPHTKTMLQRQIEATDRHAKGGRVGV